MTLSDSNQGAPSRSSRVFFREAVCRAVREAMLADPRVFVLGQDVGMFGGAYREFDGLYAEFGPERVRDTPVAEAAMVGLGVGAAAMGMRPLVSLTYMDFVLLALDPLVNYAAKARFKTGGQIRVPMVVKLTTGAKGQGVVHSQSFESWLMSVPGLRVVAPSTARDAYGLMRTALSADEPVVFVDHKRLFTTSGHLAHDASAIPFGSARIARPGRHITITAHSYMVIVALAAAEMLAADGVDCEVVDLRSLAPVDEITLRDSVDRTGHLLSVEEGQKTCGVGAELIARLQPYAPNARFARLAAVAAPISSNPALEIASVPDKHRIAAAARDLVRQRSDNSGNT